MIGLKISRHFLDQSDVEANPIVTGSHSFSRALRQLHVITSSFDWFAGLSVSFVIGRIHDLVFGFETLNSKRLTSISQFTSDSVVVI